MIITNKHLTQLIPPMIHKLPVDKTGAIIDITAENLQDKLLVMNPRNRSAYFGLKQTTPARLGMGRVGTRYRTASVLRLRADHAAAQDSVWQEVPETFVRSMNMLPLQSSCRDESDYLTRPDHGRKLTQAAVATVKSQLPTHPTVLIAVGDGLSSRAITANVAQVIPAIKRGLAHEAINVGKIPFIKYCRVGIEDQLGDLTHADVVCLLIGERPGLVTPKSMSAYVAYRPTVGMPEARRTVISNIHPGGIQANDAGADIATLIVEMLTHQASGLALKQQLVVK